MNNKPIKSLFIGDLLKENKIALVIYANKASESNTADIYKVFKKLSNSQQKVPGTRNKLMTSNNQILYYNILSSDIIYLAIVDNSYPERHVYSLFDIIHNLNIYTEVNSSNELNSEGMNKLKDEIEKRQDLNNFDTIASINNDINDIKTSVKNNIKSVLSSTDSANDLENMSSDIKLNAFEFNQNAAELKKATCWQNYKWTLIIVGIALILFLVIGLPIILSFT